MATTYRGSSGSAVLKDSATEIVVRTWRGTMSQILHDVTDFSTSGDFPVLEGGQQSFTGSVEGFLVDTAGKPTILSQTPSASWVLTWASGQSWNFTGIVSNLDIAASQTGLVTVSCSFSASGPLTVT